jgi:hypothetical protein
MAKFRKKRPWLFKVDTRTGGRGRGNGKPGIGGSGVKKFGDKTYRRTSWHQRKIPIANEKSRKRYVKAKPNYDAKAKRFTGMTATEMAESRVGKTKIVKEKSWYNWPGTYNEESRVWDWFTKPVWSVYEEDA